MDDNRIVRVINETVVVVFESNLYHSVRLDLFSVLIVERDVNRSLGVYIIRDESACDHIQMVLVKDVYRLERGSPGEYALFSFNLDNYPANLLLCFEFLTVHKGDLCSCKTLCKLKGLCNLVFLCE